MNHLKHNILQFSNENTGINLSKELYVQLEKIPSSSYRVNYVVFYA